MRNSVLETWGVSSRGARQFTKLRHRPKHTQQLSAAYEAVPDGFETLGSFLEKEIDDEVLSILPDARRALAAERQALSNFKERPADLRLSAGLSQAELANLIGTSQPRLSLWESGKERPSFECIVRIKDALGVGFDRLMMAYGNV